MTILNPIQRQLQEHNMFNLSNRIRRLVAVGIEKYQEQMPFDLSRTVGRLVGIEKNPYSTCVDSAIEMMHKDPNFKSVPNGLSILTGLEDIQEFLNFVYHACSVHKSISNHQHDLVRSIEDAFGMVVVQIGDAIEKKDAEHLDAVCSKLLKKIKLFRARIRAAYYLCETGARYAKNDGACNLTLLDSTIEIIMKEYELYYEEEWDLVGNRLKLIRMFLIFAPKWSQTDKVVADHLGDLVSSIEDSFENVCLDIENVIKMGDAERLDALCTHLLEKMEKLKPRIREAYDFLSDYTFQISSPLPPITDPNVWGWLCDGLVSGGFPGLNALSTEFADSIRDLERFEIFYTKHTSESRGIAALMQGVVISLARCIFVWWVDGVDQEDGIGRISEMLQRIKPDCRKILDGHMDDLSTSGCFSQESLSRLVDIILPPTSTNSSLRDGLKYLLQPEDVKLLKSDIEKVVFYAASLNYSYVLAAPNNDDVLFQLLQKTELLKVELVLTKLISRCGSISTGTFESIYSGLTLVKAFLKWAPDVYSARLRSIIKRIEQVARQAESLHPQFQPNKDSEELRHSNVLEYKLFLDFKMMKIQAYLTEQMRCSPCLMVFVDDKFHALDGGLEFLVKYLSLLPSSNQGDEELILAYFKRIDKEETPPYTFSRSNQVPEHFIKQMSVFLSSLVRKVNLMNSEIQDIALRFQRSTVLTLPKTHQGLNFVYFLLGKLGGLMLHQADCIGYSMKHQIKIVLKELHSLRSFLLMEVVEKRKEDPKLKDILGRVIWALYKADYIIDWIVRVKCDWNHMLWLSIVIDEVKVINSELTIFVQRKNDFAEVHTCLQVIITKTIAPQAGEAWIPLKDQEDIIIDRLTMGRSQRREVVTISGMAGIGKTTLAKKVYDNPRVQSHFHRLAWCRISQVYQMREVLLNILNNITESSTDEMDTKTDEDLLHMLYQSLKGKRYLIVMDDVWGTQEWEELRSAFSDDHKGSRILITTRNREIGLKCQHDRDPHTLRFLTQDESWNLLRKKVFQKDECPDDLLKVGMEIAEGCKGLPLAIVAIAGILKSTDVEVWKRIKMDLNSHILEEPEIQCMHILELSYNHLPDFLRPCFLYFAAFGEDVEVSVRKLIKLWIAEGFIGEVHDQKASPEDVGAIYVQNLIARSLLIAAKTGSSGRVKTCKVHDMLHEMCLKKVKEENFLQYVNGYEKIFHSSNNQLDYSADSEYPSISVVYEQHRVSICSKRKHFVMLKPSGPFVRTLLFSAASDSYPRCPYDDVSFIAKNFKILNILDIEGINIGSSLPEGIELLYPLRYLAISGDIRSVPSTISQLWNLETFIVKGLMGKVALPDTIWTMSRLRHLHVSTRAILSLQGESISSCPQLHNMVSLSCPSLSHGDNSAEMMKLFPKLRNLKCTFSERVQHSEKSILFPILDYLVELESLKVSYYGNLRQYCQLKGVSFPLNLKRLSLSDFRFTWNDFSAIGKLPSLEILKLVSIAFDTPTWEMKDDEFLQLKYLKLESLKIVEWNVLSDHLPNLEKLVLRSCMQLEEIPSSFGEIPTLQMIELKWCSGSAEKSIMTIQEQQLDYGNDEFKVFINGSLQIPDLP